MEDLDDLALFRPLMFIDSVRRLLKLIVLKFSFWF